LLANFFQESASAHLNRTIDAPTTIRYKPFNDLTFRATYSEGFSAPSLADLFGTPIPGEQTVNDPKTGAIGVPIVAFTSGDPHLKPETAYSYYVGAVWTPGSSDPDHSWWGWAHGFRPI
jgi:outer membrane receptor protein involved in Fe transport